MGYPPLTQLKDPLTIALPGVTVGATSGLIRVCTGNAIFDGYDFSAVGGYGIVIKGGTSGTIIRNSSFHVGERRRVLI